MKKGENKKRKASKDKDKEEPVIAEVVEETSQPKKQRAKLLRNWVFTAWTLEEWTKEKIEDVLEKNNKVIYVIFQKEMCPKTNKLHMQGYMEFSQGYNIRQIKGLFNDPTMHLEGRRGTRSQARNYAQKADTRVDGPWQIGKWRGDDGIPGQGHRTDLDEVWQEIKEGASQSDIIEKYPGTFIKFYRGIGAARNYARPERKKDLLVQVFYGAPGTGKTRLAYESYPDLWAKPVGQGFWFDGYDGQDDVLIDDFSGASSHISLTDLLRILDRYPIQVPTKGGHVWWCPTNIIITCNVPPKDWYNYQDRKDSYAALKRRIHLVYNFPNTENKEEVAHVELNRDEFFDQ